MKRHDDRQRSDRFAVTRPVHHTPPPPPPRRLTARNTHRLRWRPFRLTAAQTTATRGPSLITPSAGASRLPRRVPWRLAISAPRVWPSASSYGVGTPK